MANRPWRPPARHWPGSPLIGGLDEQAGGTWLAVDPGVPRVACLLNGRGRLADPAGRRSRRDLSLRAAAEGPAFLARLAEDRYALAAYDPFHLICATTASVAALTWPGEDPDAPGKRPAVRDLAPGTHLFTNAGHAYPVEPGDPVAEPKAGHFADKFAAARPSADPALPLAQAWGDGLDPADPAAIIVRRDLPEGRVYATTSVTLVALADPGGSPGTPRGVGDALRYDCQPHPGTVAGWYPVTVG